jgi:large subunit ribosomal protein L15
MTTHKRKKVTKYRGSKTHGCGSMKKRRGAGNRGGRGMAGTGKRGDTKKPSISDEYKTYFGKHGFKKKNPRRVKPVNLSYFQQKIDKLASQSLIEEKGGVYIVDLPKLGFDKLLGSGNLTKKINFTTKYASASAVEKVKKAGGSVKVLEAAEEPKPEQPAPATEKEAEPAEKVAEPAAKQ